MSRKPKDWFRNVAVLALLVAVLMVPALEWLLHASLSPWLHIPLTFVVLNLMALGGIAAGIAYLEFRARSGSAEKEA